MEDADVSMEVDEVDMTAVRKRRLDDIQEDLASSGSPVKKPKASIAATGRGRGRGRGRGKVGANLNEAVQSNEVDAGKNDLFSLVKNQRAPIQDIVDDWIQQYKDGKELGIIALVQFFIHCCGSKSMANKGLVLANKYPDLVRQITEEYDEESGDYPIISTNVSFKRFRINMSEFVQTLIKRCQHSIIYDQFMMDHVISFLTTLADSQVRAFRHTSTVAATKVVSALVDVALFVVQHMDSIKRQHDTEKMKGARKGNEKYNVLTQNINECEQNLDEIHNMVAYLNKSIFVHRYRDVVPDIRSTCISELGYWMSIYPQMFLEDTYLKYVGWTLYDKVPEVRMKCLQTLLPLYEKEDNISRMELFTTKFKGRILSMALDKEPEVGVHAVKLILRLSIVYRNVFTVKEVDFVFELVYTTNRQLATTAGEFLCAKIFTPVSPAKLGPTRRGGRQRSLNTPLIRDLLKFQYASQFHQHAAYIVDALIDCHDMLNDWDCMTSLLLDELGRDENPLSEVEERILIEMMTCAVKQTATQESPPGRVQHKRAYTTLKEQKQLNDDRTKITEHFIVVIPLLLQKFIADPEKVANLLQIPQYFQLETYTTLRFDKPLDQLLACLDEVLDKHVDEEVLNQCAKTLEFLCKGPLGIQQKCQMARAKIVDRLMLTLRRNLEQFRSQFDDADEQDVAAIAAGFKKLAALSAFHDLHQWDLWAVALGVLQPTDDDKSVLPPEVIEKAVRACFFSLGWTLKRFMDVGFDSEGAESLKSKVNAFFASCKDLMTSDSAQLREAAFLSACDILLLFGWQLGERNKAWSALVVEAEPFLETNLVSFINDYVFIDAEEEEMDEQMQFEVLHKRRNLLAEFCKLIINGIIHDKTGSDVYRQYNKFFVDYGDIIKMTIVKVRDASKIKCARALACALASQFTTLKEESEDGKIDPQTEGFVALKDLAKKFALCFGTDPYRYRESFAQLHKEGIDFAVHGDRHTNEAGLPPPNLTFLEVLCELTNKVLKQDKQVILQYLSRHISTPIDADGSWQSFFVYRNALTQGEEMPPPPQGAQIAVPSVVRRGRGRPARSTVSSNTSGPFVPLATSTVARGEQEQSAAAKRPRKVSVNQLSEAESEQEDYPEQEIPAPNFNVSRSSSMNS